jgi:hypothetical protein
MIRQFVNHLEFPLSFLDFETVGPVLPVYEQTRPFQTVPFQFSLHVVDVPGAQPAHHAFLAEGKADPRPALVNALHSVLPENGSTLVYNAPFEKRVLRNLAEAFPAHGIWINRALSRIVDLYAVFRNFRVYHPDQAGSASMKAVLPALTGLVYDDKGIRGGEEASSEFLRVTFGEAADKERQEVRRQLEKYCCQDTLGMVAILEELRKVIGVQSPGSRVQGPESRGKKS